MQWLSSSVLAFVAALVPLRSCDHTVVDTEHLSAVASNVEYSSLGGITAVSIGSLHVQMKGEPPPFKLTRVALIQFRDTNGKPGYQPGEDQFVDSRLGDLGGVGSSYATIGSISNTPGGPAGLTATHWELQISGDNGVRQTFSGSY